MARVVRQVYIRGSGVCCIGACTGWSVRLGSRVRGGRWRDDERLPASRASWRAYRLLITSLGAAHRMLLLRLYAQGILPPLFSPHPRWARWIRKMAWWCVPVLDAILGWNSSRCCQLIVSPDRLRVKSVFTPNPGLIFRNGMNWVFLQQLLFRYNTSFFQV